MKSIVAITSILILTACGSSEPDFKTGYIDINHIYDKMEMSIQYNQKLAELEQKKRPELNQILNQIESINVEIKNSKITEDDYLDELKAKKNALYHKKNTIEQMIRDSSDLYTKLVNDKINAKVAEYGKEHGFKYIFNPRGNNGFMYGDSTLNLTHDVLEYINKK
ncbi:MAG: OmpH family outer membrane protein [Flavobacteriales bacterium]